LSAATQDLQGSFGLLVLKALSRAGTFHGSGIVLNIENVSDPLLSVEKGSPYPALNRVGTEWIDRSAMGAGRGDTNERSITGGLRSEKMEPADREKSFEQLVRGVRAMLRYA
jgi:hypothetical protein